MLWKSRLIAIVLSFAFGAMACSQNEAGNIHPEFDISAGALSRFLTGLPDDLQENIRERPAVFLEFLKAALEAPLELIALVDKSHPVDAAYVPADLKKLSNYGLKLSRNDLALRAIVLPDILAMDELAKQEGITLVFSSAYRSYEYQKGVYNRHVEMYGEEIADRESAQPGKSQHQLGTTVDFGSITDEYADTPAGRWLFNHAWRFGFSLSYPDGYEHLTGYRHEIWHYRYIGRDLARFEREFFNSIQHYLLTFLHTHRVELMSKFVAGGK